MNIREICTNTHVYQPFHEQIAVNSIGTRAQALFCRGLLTSARSLKLTLLSAADRSRSRTSPMAAADRREESFNRTGEVNVKDWGAKGDGEADDYAAFEAAIDYLLTSPAGIAQLISQ